MFLVSAHTGEPLPAPAFVYFEQRPGAGRAMIAGGPVAARVQRHVELREVEILQHVHVDIPDGREDCDFRAQLSVQLLQADRQVLVAR